MMGSGRCKRACKSSSVIPITQAENTRTTLSAVCSIFPLDRYRSLVNRVHQFLFRDQQKPTGGVRIANHIAEASSFLRILFLSLWLEPIIDSKLLEPRQIAPR